MKQWNDAYIYNPDIEDFTTTYDLNGTGEPLSYTIPAQSIERFPEPVAEHLAKHLANRILGKRGIKVNAEHDLALIRREIEATLYE